MLAVIESNSQFGWRLKASLVALMGATVMAVSSARAHEGMADLVESLTPAVVSITVKSEAPKSSSEEFFFWGDQSPFSQLPPDSPFWRFFGDPGKPEGQRPRMRPRHASGSGFIISPDGYLVTNHHVVAGASEVLIGLMDGTELDATIIGMDPNTDTALLKIEHDEDLPVVAFGDSDDVRVGDSVLAIGNPHGLGFSVSSGVISARNRQLDGAYDDYLQTDAAINFGNSGGPLFNLDGEVIGVNTAILSNGTRSSSGSIGIAFAMASNVTSKVVDQLREFGTTRRGWLGVRVQPLTEELADAWGYESDEGVLIAGVFEGPAMEAGLLRGDLIAKFDGNVVSDVNEFVRMVGDGTAGSVVQIEVVRDAEVLVLPITLGRREEAEQMIVPTSLAGTPDGNTAWSGMEMVELDAEQRMEWDLPKDAEGLLVIDVEPESRADEAGILIGDLILEVGSMTVTTMDEFGDAVAELDEDREHLALLIDRDGSELYVALERPS